MKICPGCRREINDDLTVCVYCGFTFDQTTKEVDEQIQDQQPDDAEAGCKIHDPEPECVQTADPTGVPAAGLAKDGGYTENMYDNAQTEKKKKPLLFIGLGAAICAIIVLVLIFSLSGGRKNSGLEPDNMVVLLDEDGNAYYAEKDRSVKVEGHFQQGYATLDREHLIVLDKNGNLYVYDGKGENEEKVSGNVSLVYGIRDKGLVFCKTHVKEAKVDDILQKLAEEAPKYSYAAYKAVFDNEFPDGKAEEAKWFYELLVGSPYNEVSSEDEYFRYLFEEKEITNLGIGKCLLAAHKLNILFTDDESICQLTENSMEKEKITSCKEDMEIVLYGMSDSGRMGVWSEYDESETCFYVSEDASKTKLGTVETNDININFGECYFDKNGQQIVTFNYYTDKIFRKKLGEEPEIIHAGGLIGSGVYSPDGRIRSGDAELNNFYICTKGEITDSRSSFYYIDNNGEREKVLADISIKALADGKIYYLDDEDNLYQAEIDRDKVSNEIKITSDVDDAKLSEDGAYIYYSKDYDDGATTLYSCMTNKKSLEPEKIAEEVGSYKIQADGKSVAYLRDMSKVKGSHTSCGDLYIKEIGKESEKISSDVVRIYSPYEQGYISDKYVNFFKYNSVYEENKIKGDYVYYNGKENQTLIKDVLY
ncbi:TolB-like translocation protein [Diplocloster modestus]|uniref:DUF5050 domain-containing protein n=1 Tax=Diplocloster modestus TaxID=2850322 RepID=A0ABS6K6P2_9FIRM|nr:hypothetical protein [Diplocloster modestus]MBU9726169.1 hypothetical protein [Diplocloster modestus]